MRLMSLLASGAAHGDISPMFANLLTILLAAGVVSIALARLRLATVPAYLITGAIIGPGGLVTLVRNPAEVQAVSDLAIILLMFGIGLHMDMQVVSRSLKQVTIITLGGFLATTTVFWALAGLLSGMHGPGLSAPSALVVAFALSMSSTVVVLRVYMNRRQLGHVHGRLALGVLILQDLIAIVLLLILPPLARWNGLVEPGVVNIEGAVPGSAPAIPVDAGAVAVEMLENAGIAIAVVAAVVVVGKFALPRLLHEAARLKSPEVLTVVSTATALGAAALTQTVGLNIALGAFLAGFLLSSTPFRHQLGGQVGAIRDVFGAVFFTAIGMSVDLAMLWEHFGTVLMGTAGLLAIKAVIIGALCWASGSTGNVALKVGVALCQAGEFSIVLLAAAEDPSIGLIDSETLGFLIAMIVVSLIVTPGLIHLAAVINTRLPPIPTAPWCRAESATHESAASPPSPPPPAAPTGDSPMLPASPGRRRHAIIGGFGLVGRAVADELRKMNVSTTIIEMNPATVARQAGLGRSIVFGDVASVEVLETAGIDHADLLILTVPDEDSQLRACQAARELKPDIFIIVRTNYVSQGIVAATRGANGVVVEEMATAEAMEKMVRRVLGQTAEKPVAPPG